jgi:3-hydroxyisobutyrate dehydrogenase
MRNSGIGFIGLGQMGLGMANNLAKIAAPFYAYDAVPAITDRLGGDDIIIASTLGNLAANCHLIFLCLPSAALPMLIARFPAFPFVPQMAH